MTLMTFFGCLFTAYGPPVVLFLFHVARQAEYVILFISSAFFWLASILISSVFWIIIPPMKNVHAFTIPFSVLFQECFRGLFYLLLVKAEPGLNVVAPHPNSKFNRPSHTFVSGLGFGVISSLISYIQVLVDSLGPGYLPCVSCPTVSLFFISALNSLEFTFLHVVWMMLAIDGIQKRNWIKLAFVVLTHFGASYLTMFNASSVQYGCAIPLVINFGFLVAGSIWVLKDLHLIAKTV